MRSHHHGDLKLLPADLLVRQEYRADDFATRWILDDAGKGLQRKFRVLMIAVALTWLFLHERVLGKGSDHPPAILRFREAAELFEMGERSVGLENAAYVFKALLDPATQAPPHETPREKFRVGTFAVRGRVRNSLNHLRKSALCADF